MLGSRRPARPAQLGDVQLGDRITLRLRTGRLPWARRTYRGVVWARTATTVTISQNRGTTLTVAPTTPISLEERM